MIINQMSHDQKQRFNSCIKIDSNGLYYVDTDLGSAVGTSQTSGGSRSDIMRNFDHTIVGTKVRVVSA